MEGSEDYGKRYVDFQDTLKKRISLLFMRHVQPRSVLHIIPSISEKVLTETDKQCIQCVSDRKGEIMASQELLQCLSLYENWFFCVLKLLQHPDVKLTHIAQKMKSIYDQVYDEFYSQSVPSVDETQNQATKLMTKQQGPSNQDCQRNNEGDYQEDVNCQENSKSTIFFLFCHHVNLHQFLRTLAFVSSDQKIHSDKDMVEKIAEVSGDDMAKKVLVDCITAHKSWFPCMLKVFDHENMNLKPLADILQMIHDKQDSEGRQTPQNRASAARDQIQAQNDIWKPLGTEREDRLSTLTLVADSAVTFKGTGATTRAAGGDSPAAAFQYRLKMDISHTFAAFVDIHKFLHIIPQINTEVLTVVNVLEIQAVARTNGKISASYHLLDSIVRYKDWFSLLLQVLRHAEMKLSHVADKLQAIQDDTSKKFKDEEENSTFSEAHTLPSDDMLKTSEYDVNVMKTKRPDDESSLMFQQKLKAAIAHHFIHHVRPMSVLSVFPCINQDILTLADIENITLTEKYEGSTRAAHQLLDCLVVYKDWFPCLLKVLQHSNVKLNHVAAKFEEIYERTQKGSVTSEDRPQSLEEEKYEATETVKGDKSSASVLTSGKVKKHGPEYDYTYLETSKAMKTLPGWHEHIREHMVEDRLKKLTASDGHYILWYWERKKRPAMCVTYKNKIRTFVVHKQIGPKNKATMHYIDGNERHDADLLNLVEFHLRKGLPDRTNGQDRILFLEPVPSLD